MKTVEVPIDKLIAAEYNPRTWSDKAIKDLTAGIKEFGVVEPILANSAPKRKNVIIGGHFRVKVARDLGYKTVPVVYVNIPSLKKEKELNLRLNKNLGEWDMELLAEFDEDILKMAGFDNKDIDDIFKDEDNDDDFDPDEALAGVGDPKSKPGTVYALGEHRLMCADATNLEDVRKLFAGGDQAGMVFTDPPYNVDYQGIMSTHKQNKREKIQNDSMSEAAFHEFLDKAIANMLIFCNGSFYICMSSKELGSLRQAFERGGGHWQSYIVWAKNTFTLSRSDWQNQYEPILYGWNGNNKNHQFAGYRDEGNVWKDLEKIKPTYDGKQTVIKIGPLHLKLNGLVTGKVCDKENQTDLWLEKKPSKSAEHPTMKPVNLVSKAIRASSERDDIVMDLFGGSGSTLIAAEKTKRRCYMMELDPKYCDVIIKRWEDLTKGKAEKYEQ